MSEPIDVARPVMVAMPLAELSKMSRQVGFLEGAMMGLRFVDDVPKALDSIVLRYAEITGAKP